MPSHRSIGEVVLQFREALPLRVSLAASSALQSAIRPGASGSGTATLLVHTDGVGVAVGVAVGVGVMVGVAVGVGVVVGVVVAVGVAVGTQNSSPRFGRSFRGTLLKAFGIHPLSWLPASHN